MKNLLFLAFFCLILISSAYAAESFSFQGIQWSDSRETVNEKLEKSKDLTGLGNEIKSESLGDNADIPSYVWKNNKILKDLETKLTECGEEPIVGVDANINIDNYSDDTIIGQSGACFYFSAFDNKLLYYTVSIANGKTDTVLQSLKEKYGEGKIVEQEPSGDSREMGERVQRLENKRVRGSAGKNPEWLMWEKENELLFMFVGQGVEPLVYINTTHVNEIIKPCMALKQEHIDKNKAQAKGTF
jgi:hypothetical protein